MNATFSGLTVCASLAALVLGTSAAWAHENTTPIVAVHAADTADNGRISISELLRVVQFFNMGGYHCAGADTEDGLAPGPGADQDCAPHDSDYEPQDWTIGLSEVLRLVQFFNSGGYYGPAFSEDGFLPRGTLPDQYLVPLPGDSNGNHLTDDEEAALATLGFNPETQDGVDLAHELHDLLVATPVCPEPYNFNNCAPLPEEPLRSSGLCRCIYEAEHEEFDVVTGTNRSADSVVLLTAEADQAYRMNILGRAALEAGAFNHWDCGPSSPDPFEGVCTSMRQDVVLLYELLAVGESR